METLLNDIRSCTLCAQDLPLGPNPVLSAHPKSKICIIGQAPGTKVHQTGIPWDDPSGENLRKWLGVGSSVFYSPEVFSIIPMGFCYPGKGKSGDLPPRPECAEKWHKALFDKLQELDLILLVGQYAQGYYLPETKKETLTSRVKRFEDFLPRFFPLPHPSPRNRFWMKKNPWFESEVLPQLQSRVQEIIDSAIRAYERP